MPAISTAEGVSIYYEDLDFTAPPERINPPVVFIHGLGCTWRVWARQIPWVAQHRRVIALDCRGAGQSTAPHRDWTIADMASDVVELLNVLGIRQTTVVGLSMGGTVALQFALDHPNRLRDLVLAGTLSGIPDLLMHKVEQELNFVLTQSMSAIARVRITNAFTDSVDPRLRDWAIEMVARNDIDHYRRAARATVAFDVRHRLREIRVPTTIICGSEDRSTPAAMSAELHRGIPHSRYVELPGASHFANLESSSAFNRALADALKIPLPQTAAVVSGDPVEERERGLT